MNEVSEEEVEAAAKAIFDIGYNDTWPPEHEVDLGMDAEYFRECARAALTAAEQMRVQRTGKNHKIFQGLRDALKGDLVAVTIEGQRWERRPGLHWPSMGDEQGVKETES